MGKASKQQSRRELIEKMQREQERSDRRRTILIVAASLVIALGIIAYPAFRLIQDARIRNAALGDVGQSASAASCDAITNDKASGTLKHEPDGTPIKYAQSPPSSGSHYGTWAPFEKKFYTDDRPPIGNLVHNLEHGYTLVWYDETIAKDSDKLDELERMSKGKLPDKSNGKFIVAPWKSSDGAAWPDGKHVAMSRWDGGGGVEAKQQGHRQFCSGVSGEAIKQFMDKYPAADSPEPNGG